MYKYVLRRVLLAVPVLVLSSLIVFGLMRVIPATRSRLSWPSQATLATRS
jgi:ABC-type dipeptide/oligopeptide/nickel transport system permease component